MPFQPYPTYQPYQPNWAGALNAAATYGQQQAMPQQQAPQMPYQQPWNSVKVDGADEAMNRFLMRYPANMLVPGFVSDPLFDINGRQFHTLSIEQDGRRNLETFDYKPHVEEQPVVINDSQWVSLEDFEDFVNKTEIALEELRNRGIYGPVQPAADAEPIEVQPVPLPAYPAAPSAGGAGAEDVPGRPAGGQRRRRRGGEQPRRQ